MGKFLMEFRHALGGVVPWSFHVPACLFVLQSNVPCMRLPMHGGAREHHIIALLAVITSTLACALFGSTCRQCPLYLQPTFGGQ
jgi:hypothetical protein